MRAIGLLLAVASIFYFIHDELSSSVFEKDIPYSHKNKLTNGTFVFYEELLASEFFDIEMSNLSIYKIFKGWNEDTVSTVNFLEGTEEENRQAIEDLYKEDEPPPYESIVFVTSDYSGINGNANDYFSHSDARRAADYVRAGGTFLFVSEMSGFLEKLGEQFGFEIKYKQTDYYGDGEILLARDLGKENPKVYETGQYYNRMFFSDYDLDSTKVIWVTMPDTLPSAIVKEYGKGKLILISEQQPLTNVFNMKYGPKLANTIAQYLPEGKMLWIDRRMDEKISQLSKFSTVMSLRSIQWAYYILLIGSLAMIISYSRRRQREIPVLKPKSNDTLLFAENISKIYKSDHGNFRLAEKRHKQWMRDVRNRYGIQEVATSEDIKYLADKSGAEPGTVSMIVNKYSRISNDKQCSNSDLIELNKQIDNYYKETR
ncbi:MAG: hypothetical protein Kapaf2KO_10950 [Candidatus Kapaibacteriales bacterium]